MEKKTTALAVFGKGGVDLTVFSHGGLNDIEKKKVREYAKLAGAREGLIRQLQKLEDMIDLVDASWCKKHMWVNGKGEAVPIFDIEDSYLKNIVAYCERNRKAVPKEVKKEYYSRFGYKEMAVDKDAEFAPARAEALDDDNEFDLF